MDSLRGRLNDIDVSTHIKAWTAAVRARTSPTSDTAQQYLTKLRSLAPEGGQLLRSELTYARLTEWLSQLPVGPSTKRKYHAAMSSFCEYLLRSEIIEVNPMRAVKAPPAGQVVKVYGRCRPSDEEKRGWEQRLAISESERLRTA